MFNPTHVLWPVYNHERRAGANAADRLFERCFARLLPRPVLLRRTHNLCLGVLIEAVRDQTRIVNLKRVNHVPIQPHWRKDCDQPITQDCPVDARTNPRRPPGPARASSPAMRTSVHHPRGGQFFLPAYPGLIVKDSYWRWPERNLSGNAINFRVKVLGLSFHDAMPQITDT